MRTMYAMATLSILAGIGCSSDLESSRSSAGKKTPTTATASVPVSAQAQLVTLRLPGMV